MYFMRHGQSIFNAANGCTGTDPNIPDACLSDLGKEQARAAGHGLVDHGFVKLVASPYTRAIETALLVGEQIGLSVEVEPLLGEHRLYSCDIGSPISKIREAFPQVDFKDFESDDWWLPYPEPQNMFNLRLQDFEDKWRNAKEWGKTLFVSHYYFINGISGATPENTEVVKMA